MVADTFARTVTRLVADGASPDADLLRRFVAGRDEAAFALLVRRHGPMVFGVCRRTLGHAQDAEDAFQATFLVLARKAGTVRPDGVGRWLYGVAVRVANKARVRRARRPAVPAELDAVAARPEPPPADWLPLLDAALARMPDRDRGPIVLCDLLGRSRAEAAAELGLGEGTLSSRLARARDKLRARLARLGVVPGVLTIAALAAEPVPAALTESTRAVTAAARDLAEGVIRTMALAKLTKLTALGLCALGLATGIALLPTAGAGPTPAAKNTPKAPPPREAEPRSPARSDAERFRGTWVVESARGNGEARDTPGWVGERMTFEREKVRFAGFVGREKEYKLDPGWDHKRVDFKLIENPGGPGTWRWDVPGIYRFEGERLHLVVGFTHVPDRPDSFERADRGTPFIHVILRKLGDGPDAAADERKALEGTWVMVAVEQGGERKPLSGTYVVFQGERFTISPAAPRAPTEGTYTLDLTRTPRHIDLTTTSGDAPAGTVIRGVYTRDRELLTLRMGGPGDNRPKALVEASGPPTTYFVREGTDAKVLDTLLPKAVPARVRELQKQRVAALEQQLQGAFERVKIGKDPLDTVLKAVQELLEAELELATTKGAKVAALEKALRELNVIATQLEELQSAGLQTKQEVAQSKAARLKVEIELEKLKAE